MLYNLAPTPCHEYHCLGDPTTACIARYALREISTDTAWQSWLGRIASPVCVC